MTATETTISGGQRFHYGWVVLAMGTLVVFASLGLGRFAYSAVLPAMKKGLTMGNAEAGALATANMVGYLAFCLIGGALAARFGPRVVITCGLTLAAVAMAMTGFAGSFASAALWRGLAGVGSGASNVPVMGLMAAWFAKKRRGLAAGIAVAGSSIGLIVTGPFVPCIMARYGDGGWRPCWFVFAGATLVVAVCAAALLRNRPSDIGERPIGAGDDEPAAAQGGAKTEPMKWSDVYATPVVWLVGLVYIAFGFSYIIYMTFFNQCLITNGGYTPAQAGRLFMTMGWVSLVCGLIWGSVSDVIGRKGALIIVYLIHATAFALFPLWPAPAGFTISAVLFGLSAWSIPGIMAAACGDIVGPRLAPAALGFVTVFFGVGQAAGPYVAGAMADAAKSSFWPALWLASAVALVGAIAAAVLPLHGRARSAA